MGELRLRLKKAFDAADIEIPWPHLKLYLGGEREKTNLTCKACSYPIFKGAKFCSHCGVNFSPQ